MKKSYVELKEERKRAINKHLNNLKENKVIKEWYYDKYEYWQGIPYVVLNDGRKVALAKTFVYKGSLGVSTIYDIKRIDIVRKRLSNVLIKGFYE